MLVLALDLANFQSSLALFNGESCLYHHKTDVFRGQDVTLLSTIETVLRDHQKSPHDLDLIVSTSGPGSFTGIRVALATCQGLSLATGVPGMAVDSFLWVDRAWRQHTEHKTGSSLVILESMRAELYVQGFSEAGDKLFKPMMLPVEGIKELCATLSGKPNLLGNGALHVDPESIPYMPDARDLALIVQTIAPDAYASYPLEPIYIRPADTTTAKPLFS